MILDTNAVTAVLQGNPSILDLMAKVNLHMSVIVMGEYWYGLARSSQRSDLEAGFQKVLSQSVVLPLTEATARHYAVIREELRIAGSPISPNDLWIAAAAREHQLDLLSLDQDFDRVQGVKRVGW